MSQEELENDQEFDDIREDVKIECSSHGEVLAVLIPRQMDGFPGAIEGNIYVEFRESTMARNAALSLIGRKFADKIVKVDYVSRFCHVILCFFAAVVIIFLMQFDEERFSRHILS